MYSSKYYLKIHEKKCKNKNLLLNEIKELKNTVNNLKKDCIIHKQIVNNIQNIQQQNIYHVQINPFGQENLKLYNSSIFTRCVKKPVTE